MTRQCCHSNIIVDAELSSAADWDTNITSGLVSIASGVISTVNYVSVTGLQPHLIYPIEAGRLYHWELNCASIGVTGVLTLSAGGVTLWTSTGDGVGLYTGSFYALTTAPIAFVSAIANTLVIDKFKFTMHGHGK